MSLLVGAFQPLIVLLGVMMGARVGIYILRILFGEQEMPLSRSALQQAFEKFVKAFNWLEVIAVRLWRDMQGKRE